MLTYVLGNGYSSALRSLLTYLVSTNHLSVLFTTITVFEGVTAMLASPLLGLTFSEGLSVGGLAVSLPFFITSALYTIAAILLFQITAHARVSE